MKSQLRLGLTQGASYLDEPVFNIMRPLSEHTSPIALGIKEAFNGQDIPVLKEFLGYERVFLRWLKPDGNGGLTPCNDKQNEVLS